MIFVVAGLTLIRRPKFPTYRSTHRYAVHCI